MPGEDQHFLILVIDDLNGEASNIHRDHYEQQATSATIQKNSPNDAVLWDAKHEGAQLWVSKGAFVAPICMHLAKTWHNP